jgi:hypothetical protein
MVELTATARRQGDLLVARWLRRSARVAATVLTFGGAVVIAGWILRIPWLTSLHPALASMKANTALCFAILGVELLFETRVGTGAKHAALVLGAAVAVLSLLTLGEEALGTSFGIDEVFVRDIFTSTTPRGRMSPATAFALLLLGGGLLLRDVHLRRCAPAEWLALGAGLVGLLALLGYAYGVRPLYAIASFGTMALHTSLFLVTSLAVLAARPERGLMRVVAGEGPGGQLARRLLPAAILVPALFGGLRLWASSAVFTMAASASHSSRPPTL